MVAMLLVPTLGPAQAAPQPQDPTWTAEWAVVGNQAKPVGALAGLERPAARPGLVLAAEEREGTFESEEHDAGHEFMAIGALWQAQMPAGAGLSLEVRSRGEGAGWGPWQALVPDPSGRDEAANDTSHSELVIGEGRYLQVRATLSRGSATTAPSLESLKLVAIDARPGPQPAAGVAAAAATGPAIISRAAWGANEAWMTWAPEYAPVLKFVVHHTATTNNIPDPAATVRAIYYYHAVTLGWGDIGYNYVIDREGRIYEGRAGGDGVIGGHARPYNRGTVGVAILGDYTASDVPAAAVSSLVELLAWKCNLHFVHPLESGWLLDRSFPNIMGHRDCNATTCPGDRAYALLPQIRTRVWERMQAIPPRVVVTAPKAEQAVSGICHVSWQVSPAVSGLSVAVDGEPQATPAVGAAHWPWDTTTRPDGRHILRLAASTSLGQTSAVEVPVQVDNNPPTGTLSAPRFTKDADVELTLTCADCTQMQFGAGWRWEGENLQHAAGTGQVSADPLAANGRAWYGQAGQNSAGPWYGPYFCGLPAPGDYEAVFWLRTGRNDLAATVADLDVSDQMGMRILAGPLSITADRFGLGRYQPFRLPFHYPDLGTSCQGGGNGGLELRTWYKAAVDLWLDRVEIFTAPEPFAATRRRTLPAAEGAYPVEVRFLDSFGNASRVYSQTVTVDHTLPVWGSPGPEGLPVQDALSGLDGASAAYALSSDGVSWSGWIPVPLAAGQDSATAVVPAQADWPGNCVRVRVRDRAGNVATSTPVAWFPGGPYPTPDPGSPPPAYGHPLYLPLVVQRTCACSPVGGQRP